MNLWHDIRYAVRMLRHAPGFTATAVLTLGIGIGATTAVYSVGDALLWKPIPLPDMETLAAVQQRVPGEPNSWDALAPPDLEDIRHDSTSYEGIAAWEEGMANIVGSGDEPDRVFQALVAANFFDVLRVQPALGRGFLPGEDQPGREREVILADKLWRNRFGADPAIIGKTIRLDDQNFQVVGVMPASFGYPVAVELWTPLALTREQQAARNGRMLNTVARLKSSRGLEAVNQEVSAIGTRLRKDYPDTNKNRSYTVLPLRRTIVDRTTEQYLTMLLGSVVFVLLIGCANVANLQFARATGRLREVAVRTALGAGRGRVITQLVTESVLVSLAGALFGLLIAKVGIAMVRNNMPPEIERFIFGWRNMQLDGRALLFTLAASVAAGVLSGLAPAWQCSRPNLTETLKEGGRGSSAGGGRRRLRGMLVAAEIALAVVLLVGAGLMVRGFQSMLTAGERMEPPTLLTLRLALTDSKYKDPHAIYSFYRTVLERIGALPGVRSTAAITALPYTGHANGRAFTIEGRPAQQGDLPSGMYQVASPSYFRTLHVPLLSGRLLEEGDGPDAPKVAVISEGMAKRWWKNESPLGKRIRIGGLKSTNPWLTIVGVAGDMVHDPYDREPRKTIYLPFQQAPMLWMDLAVRTAGDPMRVGPAVTAAVRSVDPEQPVTDMMTMQKVIHNQSIGLGYVAWMMGIFGMMALVLSAIGVYGVMAYLVSEQTHEIGIRMALGAPREQVMGMIFRRGMLTIVCGLIVGLPVAFVFARLMASLIFGVSSTDLPSFIGIPAALVAAAALAIYVPARRAMKIDPIVALRYE